MKRLLLLFVCVIPLLVSGCATKQLTREEQLAMQQRNMKAAVRNYQGFTKNEIANAAEKVLYLIDPADSKIIHQEDKVINYRYFIIYLGLGSDVGYDTWVVTMKELEDKSIDVSVMVGTISNSGLFITAPQPKSLAELNFETDALDEAESMLFFERLDYFLGTNPNWRSCENVKEWVRENNYQGIAQEAYSRHLYPIYTAPFGDYELPLICGHNWVGIEDKSPEYLSKKK